MANGPGKYDGIADLVLATTLAEAVVVIIVNGRLGGGMSVKMSPEIAAKMPQLLRDAADEMERDLVDLAEEGVGT
jgi:hypothetical protein